MDFTPALITDIESLSASVDSSADYRAVFLDWLAGLDFLKISVSERELLTKEKYHRFVVRGKDSEGILSSGFGRSRDQLTAATIAGCEMIERFVCRKILRASNNLLAPMSVFVEDGGIDIQLSERKKSFPTMGLHSSNGWAVHFSVKQAINNAVREVLERHILLLSYLKNGWSGFLFDEQVPFEKVMLTPGIARISVGGFKAGIVLTEGGAAPGVTFGYLCQAVDGFEASGKWLSAFFESYEQWIDLTEREEPKDMSVIESYQWHHLKKKRPDLPLAPADELVIDSARANIAVFNVGAVLKCPTPLYAAFVYGGDLIPLFLKQKLSIEEQVNLREKLALHGIKSDIPEYHPIL